MPVPRPINSAIALLYFYYGLAHVWGASMSNPDFLLDAYWAKIIGQTGLLGTLLYGSALFVVMRQLVVYYLRARDIGGWVTLAVAAFILTVSIATSAFTDEYLEVVFAFYAAYGCVQAQLLRTQMQKRSRGMASQPKRA